MKGNDRPERIERVLRKLRALTVQVAMLQNEDAVPTAAEEIIDALARSVGYNPPPITMGQIVGLVSERMHISRADLLSKKRSQHIALVRHLAMFLARELTTFSFPEIGQYFGRDHSTVIHAYNLIRSRAETEKAFAANMLKLKAALEPKRPEFIQEAAA